MSEYRLRNPGANTFECLTSVGSDTIDPEKLPQVQVRRTYAHSSVGIRVVFKLHYGFLDLSFADVGPARNAAH